ncbi:RNA polymerase factor sigma-54 [Oleiagrimonas soli]|uniref:RNA polymerase sigma-54 factor n=1 Tax=Oleiagrimonas soli TaxID=1543381 RepID=A0A099CTD1_9GAMM|nr:RNA polymerase factor sigma-54 [Oleiagrimonas soli]KGI77233.1 RNA polymerase subunit sigma-54 [Oleiagrimonas soli]MBB6185581.1 RNA polymerase sigma-54 factor [Oleiagrimonas soli]
MKPGLQLRLNQQLALTPQLQQAIRLLQLSQLELETELRQITETNPLLEFADESDEPTLDADGNLSEPAADAELPAETAAETKTEDWENDPSREAESYGSSGGSVNGSGSGGDEDDFEPQNAAPEGLREHLVWQLNLESLSPREEAIALAIIDGLDDDGYLHDGLAPVLAALPSQYGVDEAEIDAVRRRLQLLDPAGVASLDLRDCLLAQLQQLETDTPHLALACGIVEIGLDLLAKNDLPRLAGKLKAQIEDVADASALIRSLDPRPGARLDPTPVEYVTPDAYVWRDGTRWRVSLSPDSQPRLGLNQHYCSLIKQATREDAAYLRGRMQEARWLLKSLQSRADTILKVAEAIVRRQSAFLDYGPEAMRPLVLREVAEQVGMHESTISRVTTRKYLHTPRGTFEFKYFFSSGVSTDTGGSASATAIQAMLRKLVDEEDTSRPLSDKALAEQLNERGIQVARRTVAKYREQLRIPSSNERQRIN